MRTLVLDTSAFVMGFNPLDIDGACYSPPRVADELSSRSLAYVRFLTSKEVGKLLVQRPTDTSTRIVKDVSKRLGEGLALSDADFEVLALALDLRREQLDPTVVSDDYAIQNVAESLKIDYSSLATFGISYSLDWISYCPACYRRHESGYTMSICEVCGTTLRRRALRKSPARKGGKAR